MSVLTEFVWDSLELILLIYDLANKKLGEIEINKNLKIKMKKQKRENNLSGGQRRFKYSMTFELAMREILGDEAYHSAGSVTNPSSIKKICKKALNKIKQRIDNIATMDERLRAMLFSEIHYLEEEISKIDKENNDWEIISILFHIIARLLGYDWISGKICREVIYYQTKDQAYRDYVNDYTAAENRRKKYGTLWKEANEIYLRRYKEVFRLREEGFHPNQIARIINTTEYAVKQMLKSKVICQILKLSEQGLSDEEIAKKLNLSSFTIINLKNKAWLKAEASTISKRRQRKEV